MIVFSTVSRSSVELYRPADFAEGGELADSLLQFTLNKRTFSIAITAWSAKVRTSESCFSLSLKPGSRCVRLIVPMPTPSRMRGMTVTERIFAARAISA
jgi:hypothetical protein